MTAFLRFSQRKDFQYYQPDLTGPSGGDGNGYIHVDRSERFARLHLDRHADLAFGSPPGLHPYARRQGAAVSGRPEPGQPCSAAFKACRPRRISPADSTRRPSPDLPPWAARPAIRSSRILLPGIRSSIISKTLGRHSIKVGYEFLTIRTEILDINPLYGQDTYSGSFSKPTCAQLGQPPPARSRPTPPATASRTSCSASQPDQPGQLHGHQPAAIRALAVRSGRLSRDSEADAERRAAVGVRVAAL